MQKIKLFPRFIGVVLFFGAHASQASLDSLYVLAVPYGPPVQLLQDPGFKNGFRAFWTCKNFPYEAPSGLGPIGECREYYTPYANTQGKNYTVHTWPDSWPANYWSDENKFWNFNEGIHAGFTLHGYQFPLELPELPNGMPDERNYPTLWPSQNRDFRETELAVHRLEANRDSTNGVVTGGLYSKPDDADLIWLQAMNNLSPNDPHAGGMIRNATSDRKGTLTMFMDTMNEFRNVATQNISQFAYDTWPHFSVDQTFKKPVDLATLSQVIFEVRTGIPCAIMDDPGLFLAANPAACHNPGGWHSAKGRYQAMDYGFGLMLRRKDGNGVVFLGYPLYSKCTLSDEAGCNVGDNLNGPTGNGKFFVDQFTQAAYRGPVNDVGGILNPGDTGIPGNCDTTLYEMRHTWFDLRALLDKGRAYAASLLPYTDPAEEARRVQFINTPIEDYYLAHVGIGWETLGYQRVKSVVSGISLYGSPKMIFDSEVYQESSNANEPSLYKAWYGAGDEWTEGKLRAHWAKYGCHEGLAASTTFDVKIYMDRWGAVGDPTTGNSTSTYNYMPQCYNSNGTRNYACAIAHYVIYGRIYGHWGNWMN